MATSTKKKKSPAKKGKQRKNQRAAAPPPAPRHFHELWGLGLALAALFSYISLKFPDTTGLVGHWLVEVALKSAVGQAAYYFPLFLIIPAIMLMIARDRWRTSVLITTLGYISFSIFLELIYVGVSVRLNWSLQPFGGGLIGASGLYFLNSTIGINGTRVFLVGMLLLSALVLLNLSVKDVLVSIIKAFSPPPQTPKSEDGPELSTKPSALSYWVKRLFYKRRVITVPDPILVPKPTSAKATLPAQQPFTLPSFEEAPPEPVVADVAPAERKVPLDKLESTPPKVKPAPKQPVVPPPVVVVDEAEYEFPPLDLLEPPAKIKTQTKGSREFRQQQAQLLEQTLASFNVQAQVVNITPGPSVTRYELEPGVGVKVSKITNLSKDIALKLAAPDVRIEAPIPGKALVGIEVPNQHVDMVTIRTIIEKTDFIGNESRLVCAMGLTITGDSILMDLGKMPHVLIAGATGSGKSVCVNAIIVSILLRQTPEDVKFLMIDPKKVELSLYEGIPHLIAPVVTNPNQAAATLKQWALAEMERRYQLFSEVGVKTIAGYNDQVNEINALVETDPEKAREKWQQFFTQEATEDQPFIPPKKLPYIVVIIDELADLMMVASQEVESTICRLAQMARATGIHLVIATQRPSVNVVTGLIKANVPSRVSFFLQSQIDSRTILDMPGAEKLLGKGDMLYSPVGSFKPKRVQGVFVSEKEVKQVVSFLKTQGSPDYSDEVLAVEPLESNADKSDGAQSDDMYEQAKSIIQQTQYASTSYLQRKLRIGYNRAARIIDELCENGVITQSPDGKGWTVTGT